MIYDVHAHLDFLKENKLKEIQNNKKISAVISNSINIRSFKKNLELSKRFSKIKVAAGLYPQEDISLKKYALFEKLVLENKNKISAIGEIGLDLYHTKKILNCKKKFSKIN
jgi:TatD DNase family protein